MLLNRTNLVVVALATDDEERPALMGLRVESDGTTVATNGHYMGIVGPARRDVPLSGKLAVLDEEAPRNLVGLLPKKAVVDLLRAVPKKCAPDDDMWPAAVVEALGGGTFSVATSPDGSSEARISGPESSQLEFAGWKQVVPTTKPLASLFVGTAYLARCAKVAEACGLDTVKLSLGAEGEPVRLEGTLPDGQAVTVLLMPRREG